MTRNEIITSLHNWKAIQHDGTALVHYFKQGNCFFYKFDNSGKSSESVHAYPGIFQGDLYFFLILAEYDCAEYSAHIENYISACPVLFNLGSNRLPPSIAKTRIKLWDNEYPTWVPNQAATADGIYLAFDIEVEDFEVSDTQLNFALRATGEETTVYAADMIVTNRDSTEVYYDDFSHPVPPFTPTASAESFYLLQL